MFSLNALSVSYSPSTLSCGTTVVTATFDCAFSGSVFMSASGGADFDTDPPIYTATNGTLTFNLIIEPGDATTITLSANILSSDLACATGSNNQTNATVSHDCIPPPNDNCVNATFVPITQASCVLTENQTANQTVSGTVPSCSISGYVDLWYTFTANNTTVSMFLGNLPGSFARYGVYESCGGTEKGCGFYLQNGAAQMISGLTIGEDYVVQIQTISSASGGIQEVCFFSQTSQNSTVPVIIESFTVENIDNKDVQCNFTISSSFDLEHVEVQRRSDQNTFFSTVYSDISHGSDLEDYEFTDHDIEAGNRYYYRLKTFDLDGKVIFSEVKSVHCNKGNKESDIRLYPNPSNTGAYVELPRLKNEPVHIWIQTVDSKKLVHVVQEGTGSSDNNIFYIPENILQSGLNIVIVRIGDDIYREKLIKF